MMQSACSFKPEAKTRRQGQRAGRGAAAAAEFALISPFLAMLVMGMFELSRGMLVRETLCNAARKGCRTGIIHQYGNSDITNDCLNIMKDNGYTTSQFNPPSVGSITITVTDPNGSSLSDALDAPPGSKVTVQISIPVSSVAWVTPYFLPSTSIESDVVVMMKQ
jgi:Flp pilus assembly protein TadG